MSAPCWIHTLNQIESNSAHEGEAVKNIPSIFVNQSFGQVRVIINEDNPWFAAKDICNSLGYIDSSNAIKQHCKINGVVKHHLTDSMGRSQLTACINEQNLYRLIMRSNLPSAEKFEDWVVGEVLPSIRKHGFYGTDNFVEDALNDPDGMIAILERYKAEQQQRRIAEQQRDVAVITKALIGKRREATAMNTASQYSKENNRLLEQLGNAKTWKQAKAIPWLKDFFVLSPGAYSVIGKRLSKVSREFGYETRKIEDTQWGSVKAYRTEAIDYFKHQLIEDRNLMKKYRKYSRCA